jgi:hypothetical protein
LTSWATLYVRRQLLESIRHAGILNVGLTLLDFLPCDVLTLDRDIFFGGCLLEGLDLAGWSLVGSRSGRSEADSDQLMTESRTTKEATEPPSEAAASSLSSSLPRSLSSSLEEEDDEEEAEVSESSMTFVVLPGEMPCVEHEHE